MNETPTRTIAASLLTGAAVALALCLVAFPGAREGVVTGSILVGFGCGWATLALLSGRRSRRPQRWAAVPAAAMTATGVALVVAAPDPETMDALVWVWPPALLVLVGWMSLRVLRSVTGRGRWLLAPVLATLALIPVGATVTAVGEARLDRSHPAPGSTYAVGDHRLHLWCQGQGSPTVVLLNGLGGISTSWAHIAESVSPTTRVCAFDRAGQGWSDDVAAPQDGVEAADDLHALLAAAGEVGPFVLVGHSLGGPHALTYTARYPDQVAGLVLLDSSSPEQLTTVPAYPLQYALMRRGLAVLPTLARVGLGPLFSVGADLPADVAEATVAMTGTTRALRNGRDEISMVPTLLEQSRALTTLGDRPLAVLTATESLQGDGWREAQDRLAELSDNRLTGTLRSSHAGMVADPLVATSSAAAISAVVASLRSGQPLR